MPPRRRICCIHSKVKSGSAILGKGRGSSTILRCPSMEDLLAVSLKSALRDVTHMRVMLPSALLQKHFTYSKTRGTDPRAAPRQKDRPNTGPTAADGLTYRTLLPLTHTRLSEINGSDGFLNQCRNSTFRNSLHHNFIKWRCSVFCCSSNRRSGFQRLPPVFGEGRASAAESDIAQPSMWASSPSSPISAASRFRLARLQ